MSDDYLWDGSGEPDPEVRHLEGVLGRLRYDAPPPPLPIPMPAPQAAPSPFRRFRWPLGLFAAAATAATIAIVLSTRTDETPPTSLKSSWEVVNVAGTPTVGDTVVAESARMATGDWLQTNEGDRARITVGAIGSVEVDPNSRVRLVETRATDHRLHLERGSLKASIYAPPRLFFVETPAATAVDLGCSYTLSVDDAGDTLLRVLTGWVALELPAGGESIVPAGAFCRSRRGKTPGTPCFEDSPAPLVSAAASLDSGSTNPDALDLIVQHATPRDTLTLYHLVSRVKRDDRARIFDAVAKLSPPPEGVSRDAVVDLDPDAMNTWKKDLRPLWNRWMRYTEPR